jgi:hypothetical protein
VFTICSVYGSICAFTHSAPPSGLIAWQPFWRGAAAAAALVADSYGPVPVHAAVYHPMAAHLEGTVYVKCSLFDSEMFILHEGYLPV